MKKWLIVVVIAVILGWWGFNVNNTAIDLEEPIKKAWGDVESSYQRRSDLIGNLVNTVKGSADFEKSTLEAVIKARSEATKTVIDPSNISPEQLHSFNQAQSGLSSALSRLLVTVEKYPDLKTNQNFRDLQKQLEGTENRIQVSRVRFNEEVEPYNSYIRKMPNKFITGFMGFKEKGYYQSEKGSEKAPVVTF